MDNIKSFTNQRPIIKVVRFTGIPVGATLENFKKSNILEDDTHRAESYKEVKKYIDRYLKFLIDESFANFKLKVNSTGEFDSLEEVMCYYLSKSKDDLRKTQLNLRKSVSKVFSSDKFKRSLKKELIREDLPKFLTDPAEILRVKEFDNFTTYFTGFFQNRENMYGWKGNSTEISNRVINENLIKFIDNSSAFDRLNSSSLHPELEKIFEPFKAMFGVESIDEVFHLNNYSSLVIQKNIDAYNSLIGAVTSKDRKNPIVGLNQRINEYNQIHNKREDKLRKFKPLFKQILSDRIKLSFIPDHFTSASEVMASITSSYKLISSELLPQLNVIFDSLESYDLDNIYVDHKELSTISKRHYGSWSLVDDRLRDYYEATHPIKTKKYENYEKEKESYVKSRNIISIGEVNTLVGANNGVKPPLEQYFMSKGAVDKESIQRENYFALIENCYSDVETLFGTLTPTLDALKKNVAPIKNLLDNILAFLNFIKPLNCAQEQAGKDEMFYAQFTPLFEAFDSLFVPLYNKVRNFITQKPYSVDKIKLNFDNSTLMAGWDVNKEVANASSIFIKDGKYYLLIADKRYRKSFKNLKPCAESEDGYMKMEYKLLPGANKMLPKVFFAKSRKKDFNPSPELLDKYKNGTHVKGENFNLADCHALIDFFKASLSKHEDWSKFGFKFSDTSTYNDISEFYREVEHQGYKLSFKKVASKDVDALVADGKVYMFRFYSKDFSEHSKGMPNLNTIYWKMLFDPRNLADVVYRLNGNGLLFYRAKSLDIENTVIHLAGVPMDNDNKFINKVKPSRTLKYDLIKNKRFTQDAFQIHIPITLNCKASQTGSINDKACESIHSKGISHIIGIDRGERNLLSYAVIDLNNNIIEQGSLNTIVSDDRCQTDYLDKLSSTRVDRDKQRKTWQEISAIKDIKNGYLSQVINKLVKMMLKYNAVISLESLNEGFMRSRQKIESSVYRNFEKALIDKLNYVVLKEHINNPYEPGGALNAIQLTEDYEKFNKYQKGLIKQCGFLFYVPAWCTSKIDPATGFVNMLDTRYETKEKAKAFLSKFSRISFNKDKDYFEFSFDYSRFHNRASDTRTAWTVCTNGVRIINTCNSEGHFEYNTINLTEELKALFGGSEIDIYGNLKEEIMSQDKADFFKSLLQLLHLTLQLRNSDSTQDYILSPVQDENGNFFDSRNNDKTLPTDADNNGAFNIARKGLMIMAQIMLAKDIKSLKFELSNRDWLRFAQKID